MGSAICTPTVETMSIAVQTDLLDEEEQAAKKKREMAAKSQAHLKVNHQLTDFTILGRKKASYDAEPRLAYNATYDLLNDPRCLVYVIDHHHHSYIIPADRFSRENSKLQCSSFSMKTN